MVQQRNMKISVITVSYNQGNFIERTIKSKNIKDTTIYMALINFLFIDFFITLIKTKKL